jgi:hypothetical protein
MKRMMVAVGSLAWMWLAAPATQAGDGRWNAVEGWLKKLPPDASYSRTVQIGGGNVSSTVQLGGGNVSVIYQMGNDNSAQALQTGRGNVSSIVQLGNSNSAITEQSGSGNVSSSVQIGDGHFVQSRQTVGEFASSIQTGGRRTVKESKHLERRAEKTAWRSVKDAVKDFQRR